LVGLMNLFYFVAVGADRNFRALRTISAALFRRAASCGVSS
jgi:hypothetical protein